MKVTGGALRSDKSWWYLVSFAWKKGKWIPTDAGDNINLLANDISGHEVTLQYLPCSHASEMLGVWMAPDGNTTKIESILTAHASNWASNISNSTASQLETWTALSTTISPKITYPLPASTLSESSCRSIMYPAYQAALPKAGLSRTLAKPYRHGPLQSGGLGIKDIFHFQGTSRIAALVEHCTRGTPTGQQLHICIEDLVLETGFFGPLWTMPFKLYSKWCSTHSWMFATCEYCHDHNIILHLQHSCLHPKRPQDKSIMAECAAHFEAKDLAAINRV